MKGEIYKIKRDFSKDINNENYSGKSLFSLDSPVRSWFIFTYAIKIKGANENIQNR